MTPEVMLPFIVVIVTGCGAFFKVQAQSDNNTDDVIVVQNKHDSLQERIHKVELVNATVLANQDAFKDQLGRQETEQITQGKDIKKILRALNVPEDTD